MKRIIQSFFEKNIFKNFFDIDLTGTEKNTANDSLINKYTNGLFESIILGLIALPSIMFIDVTILVSVLVPITMVSGTAWFAVSLINIKKKFEDFGNELTKDLYRSFCTSLVLLSLISIVSLNSKLFENIVSWGSGNLWVVALSGFAGMFTVLRMIYDVFAGATKYDMNDSMLTGQNESAEKYFKRSLSLLKSSADSLRKNNNNVGVTSYQLGLSFFEIFNYIKNSRGSNLEVEELINKSNDIKNKPFKSLDTMRKESIILIERVLGFVKNIQEKSVQKSFYNIQLELAAIRENKDEDMSLFNLRIATILEEFEDMLVSQGEALFTKKIEIEKKYLIKKLPDLKDYSFYNIEQGYVVKDEQNEERIRKIDNEYFYTIKRSFKSGYREEIEKMITKQEFDEYWKQTKNKRISKRRYLIPIKNEFRVELDVFLDKNAGLTIAEVEFKSEEEADNFVKPKWFGEEVTGDKSYKNANLAK